MSLLDDITIGKYQAHDSIIHLLDPRTKGFCTILLMVAGFFISSFVGITAAILICVILLIVARIKINDLVRNLRAFIWLFILTLILHIFIGEQGDSQKISFWGLAISTEGVLRGIFYSLRIGFLITLSYFIMAVTSPMEIADGLERTFRPLKKVGFPAQETSLSISIALRFVPTLLDEARRIRDAQLCRGAPLEGNISSRIKGFVSMLIPLFTSALRRADMLALALESRGFNANSDRTSYIELKFAKRDFYALVTSGLLFILLIKL